QEEFTERRLLEIINRHKEPSAGSIIANIQGAVLDFASTAEQSDDLTLLALCYRGNSISS
ncbi:MAG: hypothetical protein ACU83V_05715, partial [Gammaproteobacteria bacterium]